MGIGIMARIIDGKACNIVGAKVKEYRLLRKMTQKELSEKLETMAIYVCRESISRIEDGSRTVTDMELYGLAKVLDAPIQAFFPD